MWFGSKKLLSKWAFVLPIEIAAEVIDEALHSTALLLQFQHWKCLTHPTVQLWLELGLVSQKNTGTLTIQATCKKPWPLVPTQHPSFQGGENSLCTLAVTQPANQPPSDTHLWKTHKINIEKAVSQLIKLSRRWTAASLISWRAARRCSYCKGV